MTSLKNKPQKQFEPPSAIKGFLPKKYWKSLFKFVYWCCLIFPDIFRHLKTFPDWNLKIPNEFDKILTSLDQFRQVQTSFDEFRPWTWCLSHCWAKILVSLTTFWQVWTSLDKFGQVQTSFDEFRSWTWCLGHCWVVFW